ncbi:hypothetical protein [Lysobacter sp. Hz 25]|uniref:hypothetical protein n=1 Tax=Lysobacter sp. Hz 25 TaxID=3383698 RepID=UPI0038D3F931
MKALFFGGFLFLLASCSSQGTNAKAMGKAEACDSLAEIKSMPLRDGWPETDPAYLKISNNREVAKSCLLDRISDSTQMMDPRSEPTKVNNFAVGDLAFFLLYEFKMVPFEEVLPGEVTKQLAERGVFAYFEWVNKPGNRRQLQENCRKWIEENRGVRVN